MCQSWLDRLDGYLVAVEFRNETGMKGGERRETLARLGERNLAFVTVDEPQGFFSSLSFVPKATWPDLAVVRFHGRNRET